MTVEPTTLHDRQQEIIRILRQQSSAKVTELAETLGVSKVTIRSDLESLEEEGFIERVRGGAILKDAYQILTPSLAERARVNEDAKHRIAKRAAELVQDGDLILLDDSTTAIYMVSHLKNKRNLTIVTNGVETALALSQQNTHTVILLGGVMHNNGASVVGAMGENNLSNLRIKLAFLSCTGFTPDVGMTHLDLQDAQIKRKMVDVAEQLIALVDSSKIGKTDLTPFAPTGKITHFITDTELDGAVKNDLLNDNVTITICGETTISTLAPTASRDKHYRIGFANLTEDQSEFAIDVRHGLEQAAREAGNINLIMADNRLDPEVALQVADQLVQSGVDLAIEYQINEQVGGMVSSKFNVAKIPVIAVDIPMVGATYFGVDNYHAGYMAGTALGEWIVDQWEHQVDHVIVLQHTKAAPLPATRINGQLEGLESVVGKLSQDMITVVDGGTTAAMCEEAMDNIFPNTPPYDYVAILSFNDNATIGAVRSAKKHQKKNNLAIVGQGADRLVRQEIRQPESPVIGATAFWPERYGEKLVKIATSILRGDSVPPAVYIDHVFLNSDNIDTYYPNEAS